MITPMEPGIEVPAGAIRKDAVLTITEVEPPKSTLEVRRVFDFSVGDALLFQPVTLQIPYELEPGEKDAGNSGGTLERGIGGLGSRSK